jgi:hypothetical protein
MGDILIHCQKYHKVMDPHSVNTAMDMLRRKLYDVNQIIKTLEDYNYTGLEEDIKLFRKDRQEIEDVIEKLVERKKELST